MTEASEKAPNRFLVAVGGLICGGAIASWFALFHFVDKWLVSAPRAPGGEFIYAHVDHGGLSYFNALQSTALHLYIPLWCIAFVGGLILNAAFGENAISRRRITRDMLPGYAFGAVGAIVAIGIIFFFGHAILGALVSSPFGPSNDDLSMVTHN
ncbi:hypothetical protein AEAC466_18945 [Asticcacaulis sp. AC466]|uniref:hypothetical protein n=1 Tax=Asticcacaulis sp. AC466 TaxID=1282362 RepID=UPI0003C3B69F|nr:hypothetical protein [Asticcacaulis sp. AC466]ESQ81996.1 hypothetical protein AEAC466_18945 [Asticcacaulis sp. AC466]